MDRAQIRLDETRHRQLRNLAAWRRHAEFVMKFTQSLSESESAELRALEQDLDTAETALYQPVLDRLFAKIEALGRIASSSAVAQL